MPDIHRRTTLLVTAADELFGTHRNAFHSNLVQVHEGDELLGVMTLNRINDNTFDYTTVFWGIENTSLDITNNPELTWASETLESHGVTKCSDYPANDSTPMTQINIRTGTNKTTIPALTWSRTNQVTDCGQKSVIGVDGAHDGEVGLHYR